MPCPGFDSRGEAELIFRRKYHAGHPNWLAFIVKRLERAGLPALSRCKDARPVKKREQAPALHTLRDEGWPLQMV
jgi:hypothetical protein